MRDRASLQWSAECLSQIDSALLTPIIEGRWLDGYDIPHIFSRIQCPVVLLQADPQAGGALIDEDVRDALGRIADCQVEHFPGTSHQIHRTKPDAVVRALAGLAGRLDTRRLGSTGVRKSSTVLPP